MDKLLTYAQIAALAYDTELWPTTVWPEQAPGFRLTHHFGNMGTDTQGLAGVLDDQLVIAFRGTQIGNIKDFITDIKTSQLIIPYDNPDYKDRVHRGFMEAWLSVRVEVQDKIVGRSKLTKLCAVGHSLGGALAMLCALDMQYNNPGLEVSCRTFGQPKVGNGHFVEAYNRRVPDTIRVVNDKDIVPLLPPGDEYWHVGTQKKIGGDDWGLVSELVLDHGYRKYVEVLENG